MEAPPLISSGCRHAAGGDGAAAWDYTPIGESWPRGCRRCRRPAGPAAATGPTVLAPATGAADPRRHAARL